MKNSIVKNLCSLFLVFVKIGLFTIGGGLAMMPMIQKELIDKGLFREAQQMDIENVRALFGNKYDEAIQQMLEYTEKLLK